MVTRLGKKERKVGKRRKWEKREKEGWGGVCETDYRREQEIKEKAGDLLAQLWLYGPMSQNTYSVTWYLTEKGKKRGKLREVRP